MKCINNRLINIICIFCAVILLTGCGDTKYELAYSDIANSSSMAMVKSEENISVAKTFAHDLCVVDHNKGNLSEMNASGAALFSLGTADSIYAYNVYEQLYPASITKIMTALVAIKHGSSEQLLTASSNVKFSDSSVTVCGIKEGDQMTLDQALHLLLVKSANDAAILIAEGIAGSVDEFCELMNEEAKAIGATNTHFANPHGLSDENHYTTVYDIYLMMNEAVKYEKFKEIIQMSTYTTVYHDKAGKEKEITVDTTNLYLSGNKQCPTGITVLGGKTGTTDAAGHCLTLLTKDSAGSYYISIVLRADNKDSLYNSMNDILLLIP